MGRESIRTNSPEWKGVTSMYTHSDPDPKPIAVSSSLSIDCKGLWIRPSRSSLLFNCHFLLLPFPKTSTLAISAPHSNLSVRLLGIIPVHPDTLAFWTKNTHLRSSDGIQTFTGPSLLSKLFVVIFMWQSFLGALCFVCCISLSGVYLILRLFKKTFKSKALPRHAHQLCPVPLCAHTVGAVKGLMLRYT